MRNRIYFSRVRDDLLGCHAYSTGGVDLAVAAANNHRALRERRYAVRETVDSLIATVCLEAGHELLHKDRDFDAFERELSLKVVHPI